MVAQRAGRRQEILDAALALVDGGGLTALTMGRLAAASGASNGSIYHHFGSRAGVLTALYRDSFSRCVAALAVALDDRPAARVVPELAERFLDWVAEHPTRARFLYAASAAPDLSASADEVRLDKSDVFAPVAAWMTQRAEAGELRRLPVWALDPVVMGPAHECARRFLAAPDAFDLAAARGVVAEATWAMVRP